MSARWTSPLTGSVVHEADARAVAATLPEGIASLAILDGPYGMGKAAWDRVPRGGSLGDLYAGHLDDVGRVCAASASLYLWNTSAGWAELHPLILARGWTFRSLITWDKGMVKALIGAETMRCWPDTTEVCGFYQREALASSSDINHAIECAIGHDARNWMRLWLNEEWCAANLKIRQADDALGTHGMATHYFGASQWLLPTWEAYVRLSEYATLHGPPRERPYLVHPSQWPDGGLRASYDHLRASYDHLRASYDHLRASYDHLRAEYEASRPPFTCPLGVGNVWTQGAVARSERLKDSKGATLHPCQKPLLFAGRMIAASSRPGDTVWVPFGGTLRELVAAERMARGKPEEARRVITCELNQDGVDYIGPAIAQAQGLAVEKGAQVGLFGGGR